MFKCAWSGVRNRMMIITKHGTLIDRLFESFKSWSSLFGIWWVAYKLRWLLLMFRYIVVCHKIQTINHRLNEYEALKYKLNCSKLGFYSLCEICIIIISRIILKTKRQRPPTQFNFHYAWMVNLKKIISLKFYSQKKNHFSTSVLVKHQRKPKKNRF